MKRINKLLEKLFGLTLVEVKEYKQLQDTFKLARNEVKEYYTCIGLPSAYFGFYEVIARKNSNSHINIKRFAYRLGNAEDGDYARACAQELCDKLNEEIII